MQAATRRSLTDVSMSDLQRKILDLKSDDLRSLSAEAMDDKIGSIIDQYLFQVRPLELNAVYRARRNTPGKIFSSASDLWYPPGTAVTQPSRLNDIGQVRFYGANMPNAAIFESRPKTGHIYTVLLARTKSSKVERLDVAFIGLERSYAPEVEHFGEQDTFFGVHRTFEIISVRKTTRSGC